MGIHEGRSLKHWNYFLAIESDINVISRFIEPCKANYKTHSLELARILLASASEIDVLLKSLCHQLDPDNNAKSIGRYEAVIRNYKPDIFDFKLTVPRWGLEFTPWTSWKQNKPPLWWTANNKVKHHRDTDYEQANLYNTLNSVGALFIINLYYHQVCEDNPYLLPLQNLFKAENRFINGRTWMGDEFGIDYEL